jgi:phosphosulfolactate phosphohydrolase-like enzyme
VTGEDILAAGAIVDSLLRDSDPRHWELNQAAKTAHHEWQILLAHAAASGQPISEALASALRDTAGGRNLLGIGHAADLDVCSQLDLLTVVPKFNRTTRQITLR